MNDNQLTVPRELGIVVAGVGGQGVVFTTRLLAETAARENLPVVASEVHGMSQLGGSVVSHLRIGGGEAPLVRRGTADLLLALNPDEAIRNLSFLRAGGTAIVTEPLHPAIADHLRRLEIQVVALPAQCEPSQPGLASAINMALLGFAVGYGSLPLPMQTLGQTLASMAPRHQELNLSVLKRGYQEGRSAREGEHRAALATQSAQELELNPHLLQVPLYVAGKSAEEISEESGIVDLVKLNSNENQLGASSMAIGALKAALADTHSYPGIAERELRRKLAIYHKNGLGEQHFIVGNGTTDLLRMVAQGFLREGGQAVMDRVTFPIYSLLTTMYGGQSIRVDLDADYRTDLQAMAAAIGSQTRIVWLCSPNNPTGLVLSQAKVDRFMGLLPRHVVVVFDEAYQDYVTDRDCVDSLGYVSQGHNVIVMRSFSKSLGLANLRVGYGVARPGLIEYLQHTVLPFNTGGPVLWAAAAGLDDREFQRSSRDLVGQEREFLFACLSELGLTCLPSQANFLLVIDPPGGAQAAVDALTRQGILVRPMGGFGLPNAFRVSVGRRDQNKRFLTALHGFLAESQQARPIGSEPAVPGVRNPMHTLSMGR